MTTKRERYLKLKHDLLDNCGQCMGFRAKGIDLKNNDAKPQCSPGLECHKTCPALGKGAKTPPADTQWDAGGPKNQNVYIVQKCHRCGGTEDQGVLLPCRSRGESLWVCTRCLPALIHG